MEAFANNWPAQLFFVTWLTVIPFSIPFLLLSALRHELRISSSERFAITRMILVFSVWGCFLVSVTDVLIWKTMFIMFIAPVLSAVVCILVAGYLTWVVKRKYCLTIYINNG